MTDIFGLVQMSEAVCLAPLVGGVVDISRAIIKNTNPNINQRYFNSHAPKWTHKFDKIFANFL